MFDSHRVEVAWPNNLQVSRTVWLTIHTDLTGPSFQFLEFLRYERQTWILPPNNPLGDIQWVSISCFFCMLLLTCNTWVPHPLQKISSGPFGWMIFPHGNAHLQWIYLMFPSFLIIFPYIYIQYIYIYRHAHTDIWSSVPTPPHPLTSCGVGGVWYCMDGRYGM